MIIRADISIPVQVLVLRLSGFQKRVVIIQTFIPYMLQIKFKSLTEKYIFSGYDVM
jgi:hypothetical protein